MIKVLLEGKQKKIKLEFEKKVNLNIMSPIAIVASCKLELGKRKCYISIFPFLVAKVSNGN